MDYFYDFYKSIKVIIIKNQTVNKCCDSSLAGEPCPMGTGAWSTCGHVARTLGFSEGWGGLSVALTTGGFLEMGWELGFRGSVRRPGIHPFIHSFINYLLNSWCSSSPFWTQG